MDENIRSALENDIACIWNSVKDNLSKYKREEPADNRTTKEKFLDDLFELFSRYNIRRGSYADSTGINDGTVNNKPNKLIGGFIMHLSKEDVDVFISGMDIYNRLTGGDECKFRK